MASRCGVLSVTVLVVHLGGIWSDRAIGKAAGSLSFANIIVRDVVAFQNGQQSWNAQRKSFSDSFFVVAPVGESFFCLLEMENCMNGLDTRVLHYCIDF